MKMKKLFGIALSLSLMIATQQPLSVLAETKKDDDEGIKYVALGDSIASGYGLTEKVTTADFATDPGLRIRTQDASGTQDTIPTIEDDHTLIPVTGAYPYLFYSQTLTEIAEENGLSVSFANLASAAFSSKDVATTITATQGDDPMNYAPDASTYFETIGHDGSRHVFDNYPTIFRTCLADANLISVELGSNDIDSYVIASMHSLENPIMDGIAAGIELLLCGANIATSVAYGVSAVEDEDITVDDLIEVIEYLDEDNLLDIADKSEAEAVNYVKGVLEILENKEYVNDQDNLDIVLINSYNPWGNSILQSTDESSELTQSVIAAAITAMLSGEEIDVNLEEIPEIINQVMADSEVTYEEAKQMTDDLLDQLYSLEDLETDLQNIASELGISCEDLENMSDEEIEALVNTLIENGQLFLEDPEAYITSITEDTELMGKILGNINIEIPYVVQYMLLGYSMDSSVQLFNSDLKAIADADEKITYVDIYNIPNEQNLDPHPTAEGHQAIADEMTSQLSELLETKYSTMTTQSVDVLTGKTASYTLRGDYTSADVSALDTTVATVKMEKSGNNTVVTFTGVGAGSTSVKIGDTKYSITVSSVAATGVTLDRTSIRMEKDAVAVLKATVAPANTTDTTATWTSSNTAVATVKNGTVTAVGTGTAVITAQYGNATATCNITVVAKSAETTAASASTGTTNSTAVTSVPNTGDTSNLNAWIILMIVSLIGVAGCALKLRKKAI